MNDFHQAARYAAKLEAPGFLRWLLAGVPPTLVFRGWFDARRIAFPSEPERTCDTVALLEDSAYSGLLWAVVVEFQAEPDPLMLVRLPEYAARLLREVWRNPSDRSSFRVAVALMNLTGPVQPDTLDMPLTGRPDFGLWLRAVVRTMREEDAAATLEAIAAGQVAPCPLAWIPLMRGGETPAIIERWKEVAATEPDRLRRDIHVGLARVFADLAGCGGHWQDALEDWKMLKSKFLEEVRADTRREAILQAIRLRFTPQVPADLVSAVEAITDPTELARWFDAAVVAPSLDAFRSAVGREPVAS